MVLTVVSVRRGSVEGSKGGTSHGVVTSSGSEAPPGARLMASWLDQLMQWLRGGSRPPVARPPAGVSSFHLWWEGIEAAAPIVEASVTVEIMQPPTADRLYFWAMQATFQDDRSSYGGAHIGLQWNPNHPGHGAVNWGGYDDSGNVQNVLTGSPSPLPSTPNDPNTRDYPWRGGVSYRLRVSRVAQGWLGQVTNIATGHTDDIRTLYAGGDRLGGLVMWAEVFANCDDPSSRTRWSNLEARTAAGDVVRPTSVRLTFPDQGACPNNDTVFTPEGLLQITNTVRTARHGAVLPVPPAG